MPHSGDNTRRARPDFYVALQPVPPTISSQGGRRRVHDTLCTNAAHSELVFVLVLDALPSVVTDSHKKRKTKIHSRGLADSLGVGHRMPSRQLRQGNTPNTDMTTRDRRASWVATNQIAAATHTNGGEDMNLAFRYLVGEDERDEGSRHGRPDDAEDKGRQLRAGVVQLERHVDVHQGGCCGSWLRLLLWLRVFGGGAL